MRVSDRSRIKELKNVISIKTSYLCKTGFSALVTIKKKYRFKQNVRKMSIAISKLEF